MSIIKSIFPAIFIVSLQLPYFAVDSHAEMQMDMQSALFQGQPMQREGTGTSWLPDSSSMPGYHFKSGSWDFMLHWNVFLRYTNQDAGNDGTRGNEKFDAPNWFMIMGKHQLGDNSALMLRSMLSLDLLTEGARDIHCSSRAVKHGMAKGLSTGSTRMIFSGSYLFHMVLQQEAIRVFSCILDFPENPRLDLPRTCTDRQPRIFLMLLSAITGRIPHM